MTLVYQPGRTGASEKRHPGLAFRAHFRARNGKPVTTVLWPRGNRPLAYNRPVYHPARNNGMFRLDNRFGHYLLLVAVWAATTLPNLGAASLWDIDEGNNAEAAREMMASGNWTVPTFTYVLRVDKPGLFYWLQSAAYQLLGVNELAARLPSALAALAALLATYEVGRTVTNPAAGVFAALI